jgi:multiple sugar transport system ATP-binding protein
MAEVSLSRVSKRFGTHVAVNDLSLTIADGEFFVLLGPTGAGKTTTLRLIAGLEKPDAGAVNFDGDNAADWTVAERDVALVFQYYSLYPRYTVRQNLAFPLKSPVHSYPQDEIDRRIAYAARMLHIEHLLERKTDRLSGGEMQRVSIGRAIVREPRCFLMDEPLSNLDAKLRESLRSELKDLQMTLKATFLFVTHDQIEAMSMGDKVGILNDGRLIQVGTPSEIYNHPRDTFVASFIGSPAMNLIPARISGDNISVSGAFDISLEDAGRQRLASREGPITVGIRSEDIVVGPEGAAEARVHHVENHGVEKVVTLRAGEHLFKATVPAATPLAIEDNVRFSLKQSRLHGFDPATGMNRAAGA